MRRIGPSEVWWSRSGDWSRACWFGERSFWGAGDGGGGMLWFWGSSWVAICGPLLFVCLLSSLCLCVCSFVLAVGEVLWGCWRVMNIVIEVVYRHRMSSFNWSVRSLRAYPLCFLWELLYLLSLINVIIILLSSSSFLCVRALITWHREALLLSDMSSSSHSFSSYLFSFVRIDWYFYILFLYYYYDFLLQRESMQALTWPVRIWCMQSPSRASYVKLRQRSFVD